jgi:hypothetical protein
MNKRSPQKTPNMISRVVDIDAETPSDGLEIALVPEYVPQEFEIALAEKNRDDLAAARSGDARMEAKYGDEETLSQKKAFQIWYRQHVSGLFRSDQVDAAVAKAVGKEIGSIRRWKTTFGWSKRMENLKKEEKAEEKLLLYSKNEAIEQDSLDVVLKYLAYIRSLAINELQEHHVAMMMKLVEFAQKNKDKMDPPGQALSATGVSLTIQQN